MAKWIEIELIFPFRSVINYYYQRYYMLHRATFPISFIVLPRETLEIIGTFFLCAIFPLFLIVSYYTTILRSKTITLDYYH